MGSVFLRIKKRKFEYPPFCLLLLLFFRWLPHLLTFSQNPLQLFFTQARHVNVTTNHGDHVTLSVGFEPLHLAQPCPMYMYTRSHRRLVVYTTSDDHRRPLSIRARRGDHWNSVARPTSGSCNTFESSIIDLSRVIDRVRWSLQAIKPPKWIAG